jgi:hypothetical protein
LCWAGSVGAQPQQVERAVRNDVAQPGEEVLVFRHQKLKKGGHEAYDRISRDGVWPWFEKIGNRVVGQWQMIHPDGSDEPADHDDGYRLARYAGYEHWKAARPEKIVAMGGDSPDYQAYQAALAQARRVTREGSLIFLEGYFHQSPPVFLPGLGERYRRVE